MSVNRDTWTVLAGLAWIACALAVLVVLVAGPTYALDVLGGMLDGVMRWRHLVVPWP